MAFEQLGAGGADHQERHGLGTVGEVLEEREHRVVRPMQVLEHEHGRVLLGDVLEEPTPRGEQLLALGGGGRLDPEQREQALAEPGALLAFGEHRLELGGGDVGRVGLQDPGVGLEDLPERPERDALAVGEAPTLAPGDQVGLGRRCRRPSSATIRDLPRPGSPTTVTSWGEVAATVLSKMPFSSARSISRPMNGVSWVRVRSVPNRARGFFAWKTRTGSDLPLRVAGSSSS